MHVMSLSLFFFFFFFVFALLFFSFFAHRADWSHGISPGGAASDAYNGHMFWDMETWMYPPVSILQQEIAIGESTHSIHFIYLWG